MTTSPHAVPYGQIDVPDCKVGVPDPVLGYTANKRDVMNMKLRQVQPDALRRVMKYLGKRVSSPPSIDHTQPMETISGAETGDAIYWSDLPRIERLPPSIVVEETEMGRASGQWVVLILCECGRRWFDLQMVKTARCPRCETMAVVEPLD